MAFSGWSTTASSNTNAATGVNFDENIAPSLVNDSAREMMAQLKDAVVDKTSSQTLTNKTLTSPVINSATGIGQVLIKRKTADESVTSATLQNDDHLTFSIAANEEWIANFYLHVGTLLINTGISLAVTTPSGATLNAFATVSAGAGGDVQTNSGFRRTTTSGSALEFISGSFPSGTHGFAHLSLWVLNGANAGSIALQFAQGSGSATALTCHKGSHMVAVRVA